MPNKRFFDLLPLLIIIFIDTMGIALIIPLLNPLFIDIATSILPAKAILIERNFLYGLTLGIYSLAAFFGAPTLGHLSDQLGRKKVLSICLSGTLMGYLVSAMGVLTHSVSLILLGRILDGFTAGALSTAQAAIIDMSSDKNKTTNIGYIMLAVSLGLITGPLLSGTLSNPRWITWFTLNTPFYLAAMLSLFNVIYLQVAFRETLILHTKKPPIFFLSAVY